MSTRLLILTFSFLWNCPVTWLSRAIRCNTIIILRYIDKCRCISVSSWAACSLAFNYVYWRASEMGGIYYTPSDAHEHSYHGTHDRTSNRIGARPIVRSPGLSRDPIALSFSSRFHWYIALLNGYIEQHSLRSCEFATNTFSNAIISATVYDSYLIGRTNIL